MHIDRVIELMEEYNFSSGRDTYDQKGFGNARSVINLHLQALRMVTGDVLAGKEDPHSNVHRETAIKDMQDSYRFMKRRYDTCNLHNLEAEIAADGGEEYFTTLTKTKKLLPELGNALDDMEGHYKANEFAITEASKAYIDKVLDILKEIEDADTPKFRRTLELLKDEKRKLTSIDPLGIF
jgi:hypothetical protein